MQGAINQRDGLCGAVSAQEIGFGFESLSWSHISNTKPASPASVSYVRRRPYRKVTAVNCGKPETALAVAIPKQILHPLRGVPAQIRDDVAVRNRTRV